MCRFIAYLGPRVRLGDILVARPHSLVAQARAPRFQTFGTGNGDGFGICWREGQTLRRTASVRPIWAEPALASIAETGSSAFLAVVRSATPGLDVCKENTPPYVRGSYAFAHNGAVDGFVGDPCALRSLVPETGLAHVQGTTDSELLFALVLDMVAGGADPARALKLSTTLVAGRLGGRLNQVLLEGHRIVAVAWGNSLYVKRGDEVAVASEPYDDDPRWRLVPDRSLVDADRSGVTVAPIQRQEAHA